MIHPSAVGKKHWLLIVDEATDYKHSFFIKKKSNVEMDQKPLHEISYQNQKDQI